MKTKCVAFILAVILIFGMFCCIAGLSAAAIEDKDEPSWFATDFGYPETIKYRREDYANRLRFIDKIYLPLMPIWQSFSYFELVDLSGRSPEPDQETVDRLLKDETGQFPVALIVDPQINEKYDTKSVQFRDETNTMLPHGFTCTLCKIIKILRNDSGVTLKEGEEVWIREDYFWKESTDGTKMLYSPVGSKIAPLDGPAVVFASQDQTAQKQTVLNIYDVCKFPTDSVMSGLPNTTEELIEKRYLRMGSALYSYNKALNESCAEKVFDYFGLPLAGSGEKAQNDNSSFLPALLGFGIGVFVCLVPTAIILTVRRKARAKAATPTKE